MLTNSVPVLLSLFVCSSFGDTDSSSSSEEDFDGLDNATTIYLGNHDAFEFAELKPNDEMELRATFDLDGIQCGLRDTFSFIPFVKKCSTKRWHYNFFDNGNQSHYYAFSPNDTIQNSRLEVKSEDQKKIVISYQDDNQLWHVSALEVLPKEPECVILRFLENNTILFNISDFTISQEFNYSDFRYVKLTGDDNLSKGLVSIQRAD